MATETEERTERAQPRFSESESPPAWLIATRADLRETETRLNTRIDDTKSEINTRINDTSEGINARIDDTNARIDELKAEGRARDAKLDALTEIVIKIQAGLEADRRHNRMTVAWFGVAVAALGIIAGVVMQLVG